MAPSDSDNANIMIIDLCHSFCVSLHPSHEAAVIHFSILEKSNMCNLGLKWPHIDGGTQYSEISHEYVDVDARRKNKRRYIGGRGEIWDWQMSSWGMGSEMDDEGEHYLKEKTLNNSHSPQEGVRERRRRFDNQL